MDQQEATALDHVGVGDVLVESWGYDQTNVDFYEVVARLPKSVQIRKIRSRAISDNGPSVRVVPGAGDQDDDAPMDEVSVRLGVREVPQDARTLDGMDVSVAVLEHPDHERVLLQIYEGSFPNWRKVLAGFSSEPTDAIALAPDLVARLVKVAKLFGGLLIWRWGGATSAAAIEISNSEPFVSGVVMPVRWDFDRDAPEMPSTPDDNEQNGDTE